MKELEVKTPIRKERPNDRSVSACQAKLLLKSLGGNLWNQAGAVLYPVRGQIFTSNPIFF
jgi:hypothetical protein